MRPRSRPVGAVPPCRRATRWRRATRGEGGYLIVLTALALLPIIVFVSFSVDVGAWYARASKLQRTADAAALAGVVYMPDLTTATTIALATATKNGISSGGDITITVAAVAGNVHELAVTITDAKAPQFFSRLVLGPVHITRGSTARYEQSIPLGSPNNYFGTGNLMSGAAVENLWAAVSGYCSSFENGDLLLARYDNTFNGSGYDCATGSGAFVNPLYDANGYIFEVKMPSTSVPASVDVQVYDAAFDSSNTPDGDLVGHSALDTTYKLYDTGPNATPLSHTLLATSNVASGDSSWSGWRSIGTLTNPCAGCTYYVQVYSAANQANSAASNGFALRAVANGTFSACSTIVGNTTPAYTTGCVQVYPRQNMSVYANLSGTTATFYLASIDQAYAGRKLSISLFDVGEGATKVELLDPNGNVINFDWTTACGAPPAAATGGCSGTAVSSLNPGVSGATQPYSRVHSTWVFNDRTLTLSLTLPSNYVAQFGTKTWWRVRYTVGSSATDRTTWSAVVAGAPVHLVQS